MPEYEELTPQEFERQDETEKTVGRPHTFSPIVLQAAICALLLMLLYAVKLLIPDVYTEFRAWYDTEMERSVLIEYDAHVSDI